MHSLIFLFLSITPKAEMATQEKHVDKDWNPEALTVKHPNQDVYNPPHHTSPLAG